MKYTNIVDLNNLEILNEAKRRNIYKLTPEQIYEYYMSLRDNKPEESKKMLQNYINWKLPVWGKEKLKNMYDALELFKNRVNTKEQKNEFTEEEINKYVRDWLREYNNDIERTIENFNQKIESYNKIIKEKKEKKLDYNVNKKNLDLVLLAKEELEKIRGKEEKEAKVNIPIEKINDNVNYFLSKYYGNLDEIKTELKRKINGNYDGKEYTLLYKEVLKVIEQKIKNIENNPENYEKEMKPGIEKYIENISEYEHNIEILLSGVKKMLNSSIHEKNNNDIKFFNFAKKIIEQKIEDENKLKEIRLKSNEEILENSYSSKNKYNSVKDIHTLKSMEKDPITNEKSLGGGVNVTSILYDDIESVWKPKFGEDPNCRRSIPTGTYYKREVAAYLVDRILGIGLVPPTSIREYKKELGSVQEFKKGYTTWGNSDNSKRNKVTDETWQKLEFLDNLLGHEDRHSGNFMVNDSGDVIAIDNGLSLGSFYSCRCDSYEKHIYNSDATPELKKIYNNFTYKKLMEIKKAIYISGLIKDEELKNLKDDAWKAFLGRVTNWLNGTDAGLKPDHHTSKSKNYSPGTWAEEETIRKSSKLYNKTSVEEVEEEIKKLFEKYNKLGE